MATQSSMHAWRIPWTEEPGGLRVHGAAKSWTRPERLSTTAVRLPAFRTSWPPSAEFTGQRGLIIRRTCWGSGQAERVMESRPVCKAARPCLANSRWPLRQVTPSPRASVSSCGQWSGCCDGCGARGPCLRMVLRIRSTCPRLQLVLAPSFHCLRRG